MNRQDSMHSIFIPINSSLFDIPTVIRVDIKIKKGLPKVKLFGNITTQSKQEYQTYVAERVLFSSKTPLFRTITIYIRNPMKQKLSRFPIETIIDSIQLLLTNGKINTLGPVNQKLMYLYTKIRSLNTPLYNSSERAILLIPHQYFNNLSVILKKRQTSYQSKRFLAAYIKIIPTTHIFIQSLYNLIFIKATKIPQDINTLALSRLLYITYGAIFLPPLVISTFTQAVHRLPYIPPLVVLPTCLCANRFSHTPCVCNNLQLKHYFSRVLTLFSSLVPSPQFYIFDTSDKKLKQYRPQGLYHLYL